MGCQYDTSVLKSLKINKACNDKEE